MAAAKKAWMEAIASEEAIDRLMEKINDRTNS
jgi:hypothetical protein